MTPGDLLAERYEVGEALGVGNTGEVWFGRDLSNDRPVVLKRLHAWFVPDSLAVARLHEQVLIGGKVRHRGIVEVLALLQHEERWVLISERVQGRVLSTSDRMRDTQQAIRTTLQVAEALCAVHAAGVVHGDVRPGNVLMGDDGAQVFDLGLAGCLGRLRSRGREVSFRPGETAPEVLQGAPPGVSADLYGLGLVLHHALYGFPAFPGDTAMTRMSAQRSGAPTGEGLPSGVAALLRWLLDSEPDQRPPDMATAAVALRRLHGRPNGVMHLPRRWFMPVRPGAAWVVHGIDPLTGAGAVMGASLGRGQAERLCERLTAEGWSVRLDRDALSGADVLWIVLGAVLGSVLLPVAGLLLGAAFTLVWRQRGVRPNLRSALPMVHAALPEVPEPAGGSTAVYAGLGLVMVALSLAFWPPAAVPWLVYVGLLGWGGGVAARPRLEAELRRQRVEVAFLQTRGALEGARLDLEGHLVHQGQLGALERAWQAGELEPTECLDQLDDLVRDLEGRASESTRAPEPLPKA